MSVALSDRRAGRGGTRVHGRESSTCKEPGTGRSPGDVGRLDSCGSQCQPACPRGPPPQLTDALTVTSAGCPDTRCGVTAKDVMCLGQGCCGQGGCGGVCAWVCLCPKLVRPRASGPPPLPPAPQELSPSLRRPARAHPALGHLVHTSHQCRSAPPASRVAGRGPSSLWAVSAKWGWPDSTLRGEVTC